MAKATIDNCSDSTRKFLHHVAERAAALLSGENGKAKWSSLAEKRRVAMSFALYADGAFDDAKDKLGEAIKLAFLIDQSTYESEQAGTDSNQRPRFRFGSKLGTVNGDLRKDQTRRSNIAAVVGIQASQVYYPRMSKVDKRKGGGGSPGSWMDDLV